MLAGAGSGSGTGSVNRETEAGLQHHEFEQRYYQGDGQPARQHLHWLRGRQQRPRTRYFSSTSIPAISGRCSLQRPPMWPRGPSAAARPARNLSAPTATAARLLWRTSAGVRRVESSASPQTAKAISTCMTGLAPRPENLCARCWHKEFHRTDIAHVGCTVGHLPEAHFLGATSARPRR